LVLVALAACPSARAQAPDVTYTRFALFRIPFQAESGENRLKQVQLFVSTDQGQTWQPVVTAAPDQRYFDFRAARDGLYWFTVRTVDVDGRPFPATLEGARPGLKVLVDTQPPVVHLRVLPPRDGEAGVEWEVRDENLDPSSLRLDYRLPGGADWVPLGGELPASGQRYWKPLTNGAVEVRLRARDRADNWNEDKATIGSGGGFAGRTTVPAPNDGYGGRPADPYAAHPAEPNIRLVNSTHIGLNYEIKDKGPSGVSAVELWYTQDTSGRNWQKYREETGDVRPPFTVDVNGEGLYGFTLVVRSGVGLGDRPPQVGDQPQMWVEVDLTKPVVRLGNVDVGRGTEAGRLTINWSATDKNLGRQPITLSYAEQSGGPWTPIASNIENSGRYIWQMPAAVPYRFFIRVEAADRAGNVGLADTPAPVIVDLAQPKGVILNVEPISK
jgi:hypothetical protein